MQRISMGAAGLVGRDGGGRVAQVVANLIEDEFTVDSGRKQAANIFHHELGRPEVGDHAQVFDVEPGFPVVAERVARLSFVAGPADERVRLAGRAADQDPGIGVSECVVNAGAEPGDFDLAKFGELRFLRGGGGLIWPGRE